jgi:formate dehydrogenase subunit gamma
LRSRSARQRALKGIEVGKFNAGQKLNAAWSAGAGLVMLGTGLIMRYYRPWPLSWRTGATFVHDWLAAAVVVVIVGHVGMALRHPEAFASMRSGWVTREWAMRNSPAWVEDVSADGEGQELVGRGLTGQSGQVGGPDSL